MIKKILISLLLIISSFLILENSSYAKTTGEDTGREGKGREICKKDAGKNALHCENFTIKTENFSPGGGETLAKVKEGNDGSTTKTAKIVLAVIIKNMIVVFGVLSLFVMTIGGGYMIFHAGEESLLTRGKTMLKFGIVSLAIALSAGVLVNIVNFLFF